MFCRHPSSCSVNWTDGSALPFFSCLVHSGLPTWGLLCPVEIQTEVKQAHRYLQCITAVCHAGACSSAWDR